MGADFTALPSKSSAKINLKGEGRMPISTNAIPPLTIREKFETERVIFNPPATVVYWTDGTKTVVKCDNDDFSEEFGFAMACVRKLYGTRNLFKRQYKDAQRNYPNAEDAGEVPTQSSAGSKWEFEA